VGPRFLGGAALRCLAGSETPSPKGQPPGSMHPHAGAPSERGCLQRAGHRVPFCKADVEVVVMATWVVPTGRAAVRGGLGHGP
jgi:hypothetical protein